MCRHIFIFALSLSVLTTSSCAPMKPLMNNQGLVIDLRLKLNEDFFALSKEASEKMPRITVKNNVMWLVREGHPQFRIYGLLEKERQLELIARVQKWLNENPSFELVYLEFYSNANNPNQSPVLQFEKKLEVETVNPK